MKDSVLIDNESNQLSLVENEGNYHLNIPQSSLLLELTHDEFLSFQDKVYTVSEHLFFNTNSIINRIKTTLSFLDSQRCSSNLNETLKEFSTELIAKSTDSNENRAWDICHFNFEKPSAEIDHSNRKINILNPLDANEEKAPLILSMEKLIFGNFKLKVALHGSDIRDFFNLFFEGDEIKHFDACCLAYASRSILDNAIGKLTSSISVKTHDELMADIERILIGQNSCRRYLI